MLVAQQSRSKVILGRHFVNSSECVISLLALFPRNLRHDGSTDELLCMRSESSLVVLFRDGAKEACCREQNGNRR